MLVQWVDSSDSVMEEHFFGEGRVNMTCLFVCFLPVDCVLFIERDTQLPFYLGQTKFE